LLSANIVHARHDGEVTCSGCSAAKKVFLKGGENLLQNGKNRVTNYTDDKLAFLKGALHLKG